jgi:hypothetical protein
MKRKITVRVPCWCGQMVKSKEMPYEKPLCGKPACDLQRLQARQNSKAWEKAWNAAQ